MTIGNMSVSMSIWHTAIGVSVLYGRDEAIPRSPCEALGPGVEAGEGLGVQHPGTRAPLPELQLRLHIEHKEKKLDDFLLGKASNEISCFLWYFSKMA